VVEDDRVRVVARRFVDEGTFAPPARSEIPVVGFGA